MKRKSTILAFLMVLPILFLGSGLSACNTVKGAGQDVKSAGKAIENKAEDEKKY